MTIAAAKTNPDAPAASAPPGARARESGAAPGRVSPELAIDLRGVTKRFGRRVLALQGVDMQVGAGEVFGLLGPNGAGKSTLIKILMTVIRPTACSGGMLGRPVGDKRALAQVGYLPEHHNFPGYLKGRQVLDHYAAMSGMPRRARRRRTDELLDLVGMRDWAESRVRGYSKGMRQRVGIAQALMNDPKLVLLDEPTDGVDPVGRREIRGIVERMRDEGRTVFLNSHLLSELEMVCERVAILVKGRIASQGTLDELTADQRCYELDLAFPDRGEEPPGDRAVTALLPGYRDEPTPGGSGADVPAAASAGEVPASLRRRGGTIGALDDGVWVHVEHTTVRIGTQDAQRVQPVLDALRAKNVTIRSMKPHRPSLEDLFIAAVTDPTTGRAFAPGADRKGEHGKAGPATPTPEPPTSGPPNAEPREETTP